MQRVAIIGPGGAGKSTLARRLGEVTGLPVIHLDNEYWRPGWVATPEDQWSRRVDVLAAGDRWIIDGNFGGTMAPRLERADTVVYLDFERHLYIWRVLKRRFKHRDRGRSRPDMAEGCEEKIDWVFLKWLWNYRASRRPEALRLMADAHRQGKRVVILRDDRQTEAFVRGAMAGPGDAPRPAASNKVTLVGAPAAGKTTLAKRLSERTGLPVVDPAAWLQSASGRMDGRTHHQRIAAAVAEPAWIVDEALLQTLGLQLVASDLTICLDTATHLRIWRCLRRARPWRMEGRSLGMRFEAKTLLSTLLFPQTERGRVMRALGRVASAQPVFVVRNSEEAEAVLAGLAPSARAKA